MAFARINVKGLMHEDEIATPEQELALAQQRLAEARKRIDLLEEARLQKLRQDIADAAAADERRRFLEAEERRLIEQRWLEKRRTEDVAAERERRAKEAAKRELEQSLAREEEEQRQRNEHEREIERLANEAFAVEQEAKRREAELYASTPVNQEASESTEANGRERLFSHLAKPAIRFDGHDGHEEHSDGHDGHEEHEEKTRTAPASPVSADQQEYLGKGHNE
jgi:hypothetical protein